MTVATDARSKPAAPAGVSGAARIRVEPLTCAIGAEILNVDLGVAARDADLIAEIRALLLRHKVLRTSGLTSSSSMRLASEWELIDPISSTRGLMGREFI